MKVGLRSVAHCKHVSLAIALALGGCSYLPGFEQPEAPEPTLADLEPVALLEAGEPVPELGLVEIGQAYREVLAVAEDPKLRLQVRRRLADIDMLTSEEAGSNSDTPASFLAPIAAYEALLEDYPQASGSDELLYQLAKAYDLDGRGQQSLMLMERLSAQYPESQHLPEAEFRKGEAYFGDRDYAAAERAYSRVVAAGSGNNYFSNSLYMQGWSRFKQRQYQASIESFTATLDRLMRSDNRLENMPRGEREMSADCLRVLAVIFSNRGGSESITKTYAELGERDYQHLIYQSLGDLYLEQERYRDSADTYQSYIASNPDSPAAHEFQFGVIEVFEAGGFPAQVIEEKQRYVQDYSVASNYWRAVGSGPRRIIEPRLQQYIDELARHHHALAQAADDSQANGKKVVALASNQSARHNYNSAAKYYSLYIESFPRDERLPEMAFSLAEVRFANGDYRAAIESYQWMAYRYPKHLKAPEAAYAAILSHQRLASSDEAEKLAYIDSGLDFARLFEGDERAPVVLGQAIAQLFEIGAFSRAALAAADLIAWQPRPDDSLLTRAFLTAGHSHFELARFDKAEQDYEQALTLIPAADERYGDTLERVAASIYKQGEAAASSGKHLLAAQTFSRVLTVAPESLVRVSAQYDAATSFIRARDYQQANALLIDFRKRYPAHELTSSIALTLVENHEAASDWAAAARELDFIQAQSADPQVKREAQYLAASYYEDAGDIETAIDRYRSYAHSWPQPLDVRLEAMNTLANLYSDPAALVDADSEAKPSHASELLSKRHYWLKAMADAHDAAGESANDRSLYLAALSSSELADWDYSAFAKLRLSHPLKLSLGKKRTAMIAAVNGYERVNRYGLQEFGTRATYRLGQVYAQLSSDLMGSQRPPQLDALALEQYEILLEEQAWPFEEKAIAIHEANAKLAWDGIYDTWVSESFTVLAKLLPARYGKTERGGALTSELR